MKITRATQRRHFGCLSDCGGPWLMGQWTFMCSWNTYNGWLAHIYEPSATKSLIYICPYSHQSLVGEQQTWKPILSNPLANHLLFLSIQVSWWLTYLRSIFPTCYGKLSTCQFKFAYKSRCFLSVFHLVKWTRKLQESVSSYWVLGQQYQLQICLTGIELTFCSWRFCKAPMSPSRESYRISWWAWHAHQSDRKIRMSEQIWASIFRFKFHIAAV
jgi:hypothetical protein